MSSLYAKLIAVIEQKITPMAGRSANKNTSPPSATVLLPPCPFDRRLVFAGLYLPAVFPGYNVGLCPRLAAIFSRSSRCADAAV